MQVDQFFSDHNGQALDFDGQFGAQCVDSVAFYVRDYLHLPVFYADAAKWYTDFNSSPLVGSFDRIANSPTALPQKGDIIVWDGSLANSGGAGHIAIVLDANNNSFTSVDQNWSGQYVHKVTHNWSQVLGWLHPKTAAPQTSGDDMITKDDLGPVRIAMSEIEGWNGHDVHAGKNDAIIMATFVGKDFRELIWHGWNVQKTHRFALEDSIAALSGQLKVTTDKLAEVTAKAEISDKLQKQVDELTAKNKALLDQEAADTATGNAFVRWIGKFFNSNK